MPKILFLTSSYPSTPDDGVCGFVDDLARTLIESHGHQVRVIAPPGSFSSFEPVEVRAVTHPWPGTRRLTAATDLGAAIRHSFLSRAEAVLLTSSLAAAARRARSWADVTISHWLAPSGLAAALAGVRPHITVAHGGDVHLLGRIPAGAALAQFISRRSDRIVCVSRDLESRLRALLPSSTPSIDVVPMGARLGPEPDAEDVREFRLAHGSSGGTALLFLGRLQPIKGVDVLVDAAARVPNLVVWIAGDGPEHARLLAQARAARLRVSFLGRIDRRERRVALAACDVVAIPSRIEPNGRMEGTPVVCAESFVSGRPVIATRTGGLTDAVTDGVSGMLVAPADVGALANALRSFVGDPALRERLSAGARAEAPRWSILGTAAAFDAMISDVIDRNRGIAQP